MTNILEYYNLTLLMIMTFIIFYNINLKRPLWDYFQVGLHNKNSKDLKELYNGLYFAADEKTEEPTQKKLQDAKKKGQVPKSTDLNSVIILGVVSLIIITFGDKIFSDIYELLYGYLNVDYNTQFTMGNILNIFSNSLLKFFSIISFVLLPILIVGVLVNLFQIGFIKSSEALKPDIKKLNPIEGFKKIFSKKSLFELAKTVLKFLVVGFVAYNFIKDNIEKIFSITQINGKALYFFIKEIILDLMLNITGVLLVLGGIDLLYQRYSFKKNLKMSKHEVKEELKQMEGDPFVKSQRKQKQRQLAMNRMIASIPSADVVVTNPTHFAIGIKYDEDGERAPIVVAKGADYVAQKIKEVAKENHVPIIENKPLARTLFKKVEINEEVPLELYQAVAEILALVYSMKRKKRYY